MSSPIAWFARNPVAANLLMAMMLVGGLFAIPSLRLEVFPEPQPDLVTVSVEYRGAAPEEVEEGVCMRVEEQLQGIVGIERVTSRAAEGIGVVTAELLPGEDISDLADEIKARVDAIDTFPEETEKPIVSRAIFRRPVIDVAVSGPAEEAVLKELAERVRNEVLVRTTATLVEVVAARPYEISIEVSERALRRYGISFDDVSNAVRRSSLDLPAGSLDTAGGEILLRAKGQAYRGEEFARLPVVTRPDGSRVLIADVATVVDGFEQTDRWSRFDGNPASLLQVFRVGDQDAPALADEIKAYVAEAQSRMPDGIRLTTWQDDSQYFRDRLDTLVRNGRAGLLLVLLVLALFMRLRLAFWIALGIPVSILGALALMPVLDVSVNIVSLFAFILVLGILVDDAIVVGENVWVHRQRGGDPVEASISGTREIAVPVAFAVLASVAAFAPLLFIPGNFGQIFRTLPIVVISCVLFSLVESLCVLPSHLAHTPLDGNGVDGEEGRLPGRWQLLQGRVNGWLDRLVRERYQPLLERALGARSSVIAGAAALLLLSLGVVMGGWVPFTFFPEVEAENIAALVTMPLGTPVERTAEAVEALERAAEELRVELESQEGQTLFRHVLTSVGEQPYLARQFNGPGGAGPQSFTGSHLGEVNVELTPSEARSLRAEDVVKRWRDLAGPIPDAVELVFSAARFSAGDAIDVQLRGSDVEELRSVAEAVKVELVRYPGVYDVADSFRAGKQEVELAILPSAEALGLSLTDLARQVRQAFYGDEVQRVQRGREEVRVMVRYPEAERRSLGDLSNLRIRTPEGDEVPFSAVAEARLQRGFATIHRADRQRVVDVTASVDITVGNANEILADIRAQKLPALLLEHPRVSYALEGAQREQADVLFGILRGFGIALLTIYALLAVPLRSYLQPLLIMSAIPFGLVGALVGHLVLGIQLSMLSLFGMVALSGVVVNSSLVLVDFINRRREEGASVQEAVVAGASARFRPVFLTALTTFSGLTPIMLERSAQAQFIIPMAISLAFGVLFATFITLFLLPCTYTILASLRRGRVNLSTFSPRRRSDASLADPKRLKGQHGLS